MHLSYYSRWLVTGLCVINTCLDIQIYTQMENIKLSWKAHSPNTDTQWNLPLFSLWNLKVRLECRRFREFLFLAS